MRSLTTSSDHLSPRMSSPELIGHSERHSNGLDLLGVKTPPYLEMAAAISVKVNSSGVGFQLRNVIVASFS